jgi:hypothetical protein
MDTKKALKRFVRDIRDTEKCGAVEASYIQSHLARGIYPKYWHMYMYPDPFVMIIGIYDTNNPIESDLERDTLCSQLTSSGFTVDKHRIAYTKYNNRYQYAFYCIRVLWPTLDQFKAARQ